MSAGEDKGADAARAAVAQSAALATVSPLHALAQQIEPQLVRALAGTQIDAAHFARVVQTELSKNRQLARCTPQSFMGAVLSAAQLGLEFGPMGRVYMIPFKNHDVLEAQFVIGYHGWVDLSYRSGYVRDIVAQEVHAGDEFDYSMGTDFWIKHRPSDEPDPGPVERYYCIVHTVSGGVVGKVMSKRQVEAHRDHFSKQWRASGKGPWLTDFDAMAKKTVFKQLSNFLPASAALQQAQGYDERIVRRPTVDDEPDVTLAESDDEVVDGEIVGGDDAADDAWRQDAARS